MTRLPSLPPPPPPPPRPPTPHHPKINEKKKKKKKKKKKGRRKDRKEKKRTFVLSPVSFKVVITGNYSSLASKAYVPVSLMLNVNMKTSAISTSII